MLTASSIAALCASGEDSRTEFKRAVPQHLRDLVAEICALANAEGGQILLGVDDRGAVVGCELDNARRSAIANAASEISPALPFDMERVLLEGKSVWVLLVPEGSMKPYFASGVVYARQGANAQKITDSEQILQMYVWSGRCTYDKHPVSSCDLESELDASALAQFRASAQITLDVPNAQVLKNLALYDRASGAPFLASVLFFAREPHKYNSGAEVRCVWFRGTEKVEILDNKTFQGPLLTQYEKSMDWLVEKLAVRQVVEGPGAHREECEVPLDALREVLLNSLAHRDYSVQGACTMVELYRDRIEVSNPGGLLPDVAAEFGERSHSRNPALFGLLVRMRLVERVGSGVPRIRRLMRQSGLPPPEFRSNGFLTVTLRRPELER